jgi:hypothetical protein
MKRVVRFVEDDESYSAGDFGDDGDEILARITAGDLLVLGMVCYDENAIIDLTTDLDLVLNRTPDALLSSVWCITADASAINYTGRDYDAANVDTIEDHYLRFLAQDALGLVPVDSGDTNRG